MIVKECMVCGKEFATKPSHYDRRKTCSRKCSGIYRSENLSGENSKIFKGGEITKICEHCGKEYNVKKYRNNTTKFCSVQCRGLADRVARICKNCGKEYYIINSHSEGSNYCSMKCKGKYMSDNQIGENAHRYIDGKEAVIRRQNARRRSFGYIPLNEHFIGAHGHHITKTLVIHIPKELHRHISHSQVTNAGMAEMNMLAIQYMNGEIK